MAKSNRFHVKAQQKVTRMKAIEKVGNRFQALHPHESAGSSEDDELNPGLPEKFSRSSVKQAESFQQIPERPQLNTAIRDYVWGQRNNAKSADSSWLFQREIPTAQEINNPEEEIVIPENKVKGAWESKEAYLEAHYELLREDAIASLRTAVDQVREKPQMNDSELVCIYQDVHIIGLTFAHQGIAIRVRFSCARAGKRIIWEQSKRLKTGTILAMTPTDDMFQKTCRVVTVAARPLQGLQQNPPEVDIFFSGPEEIEMDPQKDWVMVEARSGYFEAYRHTLAALQKQIHEKTPLLDHLVDVKTNVDAPEYIANHPQLDLTSTFPYADSNGVENVDILKQWPENVKTSLDESQMNALNRMLSKRLAIVQGPPGTGKTHVSVIALKTMLQNMTEDDPPIILTAQTNHALDQMLRHIAGFEPHFIRLGGRTQDQDKIKKRTLFEMRRSISIPTIPGSLKIPSIRESKKLADKLKVILRPFTHSDQPLSASVLRGLDIISEAQFKSLEKGGSEWVHLGDNEQESQEPMAAWLGDQLTRIKHTYTPQAAGLEIEEEDMEYEQLKELEMEKAVIEEEDFETLKGEYIGFTMLLTGRPKPQGIPAEFVEQSLTTSNLWKIPETCRGAVYRIFQHRAMEKFLASFKNEAQAYYRTCQNLKIGKWEVDAFILERTKIIGLTTTGLSKYRPLIASLRPKIVLIEEAAETLEALVTAACMESLEHLILVGDHQQLRASVTDDVLATDYLLDISMFERLVNNGLEYTTLVRQRRMHPEIRRLLGPIYSHIEDHPDVLKRDPLPGLGGISSFFFYHQWPEDNDDYMSKCNEQEADMLIGFFQYLVYNGIQSERITVLTFYNGQRKLILRRLRDNPNLQDCFFKVVTVDSYQGEENDIVLLSLVRSNNYGNIGFCGVVNRVCVALSRAQRGFFIFGNGSKLVRRSELWNKVTQVMASNPHRIGTSFPIKCDKHHRESLVRDRETTVTSKVSSHPQGSRVSELYESPINLHPAYEQYIKGGAAKQDVEMHQKQEALASQILLQRQDNETAKNLFDSGADGNESSADSQEHREKSTFMGYYSDGNGGRRGKWKETFIGWASNSGSEIQPSSLLD
ncbi:MAG: hypothetical protein M1834_009139 [Cirrosporium novae-zelandiae]|nr:MAG: hypothetical protein M1834_009139 [Cirrosporium novae-zelandiae]